MKTKLFRTATVPSSLNSLLKGQLKFLNETFEVTAISGEGEDLEEVKKREGVNTFAIAMSRPIAPLKDLSSLLKLYRLFKREKPTIVHSITPKAGLLSMLAAKMAGVPIRIHTFTGLIFPTRKGLMQRLLIAMDKLLCWSATDIYPEGEGVKRDLQRFHITAKPLKVLANGNINGIDTEYFKPTESFIERKNDTFTFVFIGRIVRDKGIHELTECIRKLDCNLILVGSFEDGDPVDEDDKKFLLTSEKVKFVGWQIDVRPYLEQADALVFPSYREGFPNVPMQAGAMGLPCIVTNINGCNEIIKDGLNGKIIAAPLKEGTKMMEQSLLNTMQWFIDHREEAKRMGNNARPMIQEHYEQRYVWKALKEYYDAL